jgi:single-strand DNA-binding protein
MPETLLTIVGNLTGEPELRFTASGASVVNFTIASTPRTLNKSTNEWEDGEALFLRATVWREAAENVSDSLHTGTRVIATGRLKQRNFTDREGNKRSAVELECDEIGPSLRYAKATVQKLQAASRKPTSQSSNQWGSDGDTPF